MYDITNLRYKRKLDKIGRKDGAPKLKKNIGYVKNRTIQTTQKKKQISTDTCFLKRIKTALLHKHA
ncbi:hypothetical protein HMPREF0091_11008 [Fannyhessea vaginae DSM 15829]|uniref:Uncharacterized protein n=1 Tax=Fannyhessea vaginae DSM 15829 TaxID=525256 RepID=F1T6A8_9ACTN|nr:hypothetical protein HMPREF0091_11008 [Fannyhessea vaginae DSM 15829]